ncbi:MAG: MerR family transcriptional regulator [Candidatus Limiplasma sp.]|nr:MerR family transcriptional regulator [Clostridiales bacterium]MDY4062824.1 MerR family transcriptional regulator [Candidatus Limiplasma sp.]
MLINEAARKCGITKKAVQYYVEQGLVDPKVLENGYRDFSEEDTKVLKRVVLYRKLGLSIREIRRVLEDRGEISGIFYQRELELEQEKVKQEWLKRLAAGEAIEDLEPEIDPLSSNTIIIQKLGELFPGYYGKIIRLHFSRYLTGKVETEEQKKAFHQIIEFFDRVPEIRLPDDLREYLDACMEEGSGEEETERLRRVLQEQEYALQNLDEFVRNHKKVLDDYQKYRQTEEYQNSPACRLMETMKQICAANGYDDTFIPAMRKLSPLYNEYYEQLLKANEQFTKSYPEYLA